MIRAKEKKYSKSVQGLQATMDLSVWNMTAWQDRKSNREQVRVSANLRDRNLWIPQGRQYRKERYKLVSKSLPIATEIGVHYSYEAKLRVGRTSQLVQIL